MEVKNISKSHKWIELPSLILQMPSYFSVFTKLILFLLFLQLFVNIYHFYHYGSGSDTFETHPFIIQVDGQENDTKHLRSNKKSQMEDTVTEVESYRLEKNVLTKVMERSSDVAQHCNDLPEHHQGEPAPKDFDTGVPPLPENGIRFAIKAWLDSQADESMERNEYPLCYLPPSKSCHVEQYTVILMSHTVTDDKRLRKMISGISDIATFPETAEIILIWNSEKSVLQTCEKENCKLLVEWDADPNHPLRIFYSLENGLQNNLLNRYHPSIQPKSEALVFFDDDGPFFSGEAMRAGFALWKFNSDVQIGSMARNIRFPSKRMDNLQNEASDLASELYNKNAWQTHIHPYDIENVSRKMKDFSLEDPGYPKFTPICHNQSGDVVEYNYFVFPNSKAHMSLPSGSILHRNYLCFIWHPVFDELRRFILDHPTHPDDMTISTLVSHLSGKPLRTFPRYIKETEHRKLSALDSEEGESDELPYANQGRRRLLWQQKDWGNMREEAINSIVGYFGSINPGSVGWCVGTEHQKKATGRGNMRFNCEPEFPSLDMIPWLNEGGLGYDQCN